MHIGQKSFGDLRVAEYIKNKIKNIGFVNTQRQGSITFISTEKYLLEAKQNSNIVAAIVDDTLNLDVKDYSFEIIKAKNAKLEFFKFHNSMYNSDYLAPNSIHNSAKISKWASIATSGVKISANVIVEDFAVVNSGSEIREDSVVRGGTKIGADALYLIYDARNGKYFSAAHLGKTYVGAGVEIGPNSIVDKALFLHEKTIVGQGSKIACFVNISHGVEIGANNIIAAGVKISGYTKIGDYNWIGPSVTVSNNVNIGSNCFIALGSRVFKDIESMSKVVDHRIYKNYSNLT